MYNLLEAVALDPVETARDFVVNVEVLGVGEGWFCVGGCCFV